MRSALHDTLWFSADYIRNATTNGTIEIGPWATVYLVRTPPKRAQGLFNKALEYNATRLSDINFLREQSFLGTGIDSGRYIDVIQKLLYRTQQSIPQPIYHAVVARALQCLVAPTDFREYLAATYRTYAKSNVGLEEGLYIAELSRRASYEFITQRPQLRKWKEMRVIPD